MNLPGHGPQTSLANLNLAYPALPQTFLRIMELMEAGATVDPAAVTDAIVHDPGAVARILRMANSAHQSVEDEIRSVRRAVDVLGPDSVAGVVVGMNMAEKRTVLDARTTLPFLNFVRHSIATGFLARYLYLLNPERPQDPAIRHELASEVYTLGLMHDFGKLLLLYNFPDAAARFYSTMEKDFPSDEAALEAERVLFGFNHTEAGSFLARQLHLPSLFVTVMGLHHHAEEIDTLPARIRYLVYIVAAANQAAHALDESGAPREALNAILGQVVWRRLIDEGLIGSADTAALLDELLDLRPVLDDYLNAFS